MMDHLAAVLDWIGAHPSWAGVVVCLVALTESLALVGLIVPGAFVMFGVGALIGSGRLEFWPIMLWAVAGAIAGDGLSYLLGRGLGPRLGEIWPFRGRPELLERGVAFCRAHGAKSVVLGRFVGPLRPVVPAVAGMLRMPAFRFFVVNVVSAVFWAPAYLLPGMLLVASLNVAAAVTGRLLALAVLAILAGWLLLRAGCYLAGGLRARRRRVRLTAWSALVGAVVLTGIALAQLNLWPRGETTVPVSRERWQNGAWELAPTNRQGVWGLEERFVLQAAAHPVELARALVQAGWQVPEPFDLRGALLWLSPEVDFTRVPPLPRRHDGEPPTLIRVRYFEGDRLVLRAWSTRYTLAGSGRNIWLIAVEREALDPAWPWLKRRTLPVPTDALQPLERALAAQLPDGYFIAAPGGI